MTPTTDDIVISLSHNYTKIIPRIELSKYKKLNWGNNGIGSRWANSRYNYTVVYSHNKTKTYSENENDTIDPELVKEFIKDNVTEKGIIGLFVHSKRTNISKRPIRKDIIDSMKDLSCVCCGSKSDIVCDHKNDMYNDEDVLDTKKQKLEDFQPLCNHCNLQKRQIFKEEVANNKIYSAKNLMSYKMYEFEFPWEKKAFDIRDVNTKKDTLWYDPVEFNAKIFKYMKYVLPVVEEIKRINRNKED